MALPEVGEEFYPTPSEALNQILADLRFGFNVNGITVNVRPDSEHFIVAKAYADRVSIAIANNQISALDVNPLEAVGVALENLAGVFGVVRRGASKAAGFVIVGVTNGPIVIPSGFLWSSPAGETYEAVNALLVNNGDAIEVISVNSGSGQNVAAGSVGNWNSASIGQLSQDATVDVGGIDGGASADDDEDLRRRLIQRLSFPQVGGNVAQVIQFAEDSTAAVEKAFVFAAVRGPGSYDVAVTSEGGDRTLSAANLALVTANLIANMPGQQSLSVTSVLTEPVNVVIDLDLALPVNAGGPGGGYRDATPWPSDNETSPNVFAEILSSSGNTITVNSTSADPPTAGNRFAIWDPDKDNGVNVPVGGFEEYTILLVTGVSGAYVVTVDTNQSASLAFVVPGMFCSVGAERMVDYGEVLRRTIAVVGPGEKSVNPDIVPRGRRQPVDGISFPKRLTSLQLCTLTDPDEGFTEVQDITYASRHADGTQVSGTGTFVTLVEPNLPPTTADPPRILSLQNLAIRAKVA